MKKLVMLFSILYLYSAFSFNCKHEQLLADERQPKLIYTDNVNNTVYNGFARIKLNKNEIYSPIRFSPINDSKIYYHGEIEKSKTYIIELDYLQNIERNIFNAKDYFPKEIGTYPVIWDYQFFDDKRLMCFVSGGTTLQEKGNNRIFTDKIITIDPETSKANIEVKKHTIKNFIYYHNRTVAALETEEYIKTFDYSTSDFSTYNIIESSRIGENVKINQLSLGRNSDELVFTCSGTKKDGKNDKSEFKIVFYNVKTDKIEKIYTLPYKAKNNTSIDFMGGRIYMMPNKEEFLVVGSGYWLYRLGSEELVSIISWNPNNFTHAHERPVVEDISWDSERLLIYKHQALYILDIEEYLKYQPNGSKLFF